MDRQERRVRIKAISAVAMNLLRRHGDRGNVDLAAGRARPSEWRHDGLRIAGLRYFDGAAPSLLKVFHNGAKVLIVEWTADKVVRTSFKPSEWERELAHLVRLPLP